MNQGLHLAERFNLRSKNADVYVSTHFEIGNSALLHYHEEPHMTFLLSGGLLDKRQHSETERFPGSIMFFETGESHQTIAAAFPTKYVSLALNPDFLSKNGFAESAVKRSVENSANLKLNVLKIYKEVLTGDEFSDDSIEMLVLELIGGGCKPSIARDGWMNIIVELLNDKWDSEISLDELSIAAGVHPKTISRSFPKYFNCTLGEYRRRLKVERSLPLIKSRKLSLTEVAHQCAFFDQSHFTKTFREVTGFLPKQFQKL